MDVDLWHENYSDFIDNEIATMEVEPLEIATMEAEPMEIEFWFRYMIRRQLGISN